MLRAIRWTAIGAGAVLVVLAIVAGAGSRTATLRQLVVETLSDRLDSDVELQSFSVDTFPAVDIRGSGLVVRLKGAGGVPPLIKIDSFAVTGGMFGLLSRPRRFRTVTLQGLEINIPPGGGPGGRFGRQDAPSPAPSGAPAPAKGSAPAAASDAESDRPSDSPIRIDALESTDAILRLIPRNPAKHPREFAIHTLRMTGVGVTERMPFEAELTNPLPRGQIKTRGRFGPWGREKPGTTPVDGKYTFENADLGTIKGIGGILTSTGEFSGELGRIAVKGETRTPDFRLAHAGQPMPLTTRFDAVVDGTDGDTYLNEVDATLGRTRLASKGAVIRTPGVKGRTVKVHAQIADGYIEDLLQLSVKADSPLVTGRVELQTDLLLPPGEPDVIDRLRLSGTFDLSSAKFTDRGVREKLAEMSARATGQDPQAAADNVLTDLEGKFSLADGTISFPDLRFRIPGAAVQLAGSYGLRGETLEFDGTLRMEATISQAAGVGGVKSLLLKAIDPLFKRKGSGTVLPIRVRGTRKDPKFGLDVVKALTPK